MVVRAGTQVPVETAAPVLMVSPVWTARTPVSRVPMVAPVVAGVPVVMVAPVVLAVPAVA